MRKHIWPMSLVMSLAIIGALAAFVVLAATPVATQAHSGGDDHAAACDTISEEDRADHDALAGLVTGAELCNEGDDNGDPMAGDPMAADAEHASAPGNFDIEALDNGGRLTWEAPDMVADNAAVVGYMIDRMVYLQDSNNPIWQNTGDAMFMVENVTAYRELGCPTAPPTPTWCGP